MKSGSLVLLLSLGALPAAACEVAALIGSAQRGEQALKVGDRVRPGDTLRTLDDARLRLRCPDGSSLVLAAGTTLKLEQYEQDPDARRREARWSLQQGLIGQKVNSGGGWQVRTPTAVTAVRGTEYTVEAQADGQTAVLMLQGAVDVQPLNRTRSLVALPAVALAGLLGTDCVPDQGCKAGKRWAPERVQRTLERLGGL